MSSSKNYLKQIARFVAFMMLGALIGLAGAPLLERAVAEAHIAELSREIGPAFPVLVVAVILIVGWLVSAVHEAGHVLAGLIVGFRFHFYIVGFLKIARAEDDRIRFGLNRQLSLVGGVAAMLPMDTRDLRRRFFVMIAGGPFASLVLGATALLLAQAVILTSEMPLLLGTTGIMSLGVFAVTMLPMTSGKFMSDGKRMLRLARRHPDSEREAAQLPLLALSSMGRRPREWPHDLVTTAVGRADESLAEYNGRILAYYHALDSGDVAKARVQMERALALLNVVPPAFRPALYLEAAYFSAAVDKSANQANSHLAYVSANALNVPDYDRARVAAALALIDGDAERGRDIAREALGRAPARSAYSRARLRELAGLAEPTATVSSLAK